MREADSAFGDPTMFLEQAVLRPRHIEVQILADATGDTMHLFERDCSVQRRHQKVIEIAPAPNLDEDTRQALYRDAIAFAKSIGYENAGTVEFLLDTAGERAGEHVFIEMNPRIQVEHTVTEEITDVDLVQSQMRIAAGETLADLGLSQDTVHIRGAALQCRITTEDPTAGFRPDTGKITTYRSPGGGGIRLDGGTINPGAQISPHFDSMLAKLTCRGRDFPAAVSRARRALAEFRIRGVSTNIPFLQAVLDDPDFIAGNVSTSFIEERPELFKGRASKDRGTKMLNWLADVTVNQPNGARPETARARRQAPEDRPVARRRRPDRGRGSSSSARPGSPRPCARRRRSPSPRRRSATRTSRCSPPASAPATCSPSRRTSPGMTPGAALGRGLGRRHLRRRPPLPRRRPVGPPGRAARGAAEHQHPDAAARPQHGRLHAVPDPGDRRLRARGRGDRCRHLPHLRRPQRRLADAPGHRVGARRPAPPIAEVAVCYTGDLLDPAEDLYTLDYYLRLAEQIVESGAHILAIKDMAGLLRPSAAEKLVVGVPRAVRPAGARAHARHPGRPARHAARGEPGRRGRGRRGERADGRAPPASRRASALVAALAHTERDTGISLSAVNDLEPYWEAVRQVYRPFESGLPGPTGRVYKHEIPGGQLSNLRQQAKALGLAEDFELVEDMYAAANRSSAASPR